MCPFGSGSRMAFLKVKNIYVQESRKAFGLKFTRLNKICVNFCYRAMLGIDELN